MYYVYFLLLKGTVTDFRVSLDTQYIYICVTENLTVMAHFINTCCIGALKVLTSVFDCGRLGWMHKTWSEPKRGKHFLCAIVRDQRVERPRETLDTQAIIYISAHHHAMDHFLYS